MNQTLDINNTGLQYVDPYVPGYYNTMTYSQLMDALGDEITKKFLIFGIVLVVVGAWHMSKYSKIDWVITLENGDEFDMTENITGFLDMMSFGAGVGAIAYYLISIGVINL